ncbi:thioesterase II family protein [Tengunoibacter tsumagoiensis]|uniref:Thioesterase n=1 Tax=Tengunoibacter tsumagoiensis TaxID=2014871 RepID=A0A402A9B3_9CHLR|nr:alpha/beta fold hydrolase [Tengunoibacter tsumagoiensis]GCE15733.1 thioesterase [Tengunoibacter tsumagoiensis]
MSAVTLFCLPNAGGTATMYARWKKLLHPSVQVLPIELSGRGRRFAEPLYDTMHDSIEDLYRLVVRELRGQEFAFFGHSMGALLCYELVTKIWHAQQVAPIHVFFSSRTPPDVRTDQLLYTLTDQELQNELVLWGGVSRSMLENPLFTHTFLPILRADLQIVETYHQQWRDYHRLPCPISVLTGADDVIAPLQRLKSWEDFTTQTCEFHTFVGNHFYLLDCMEEVTRLIHRKLCGP